MSSSSVPFEDATRKGLSKAAETVDNMKQAWIMEQKVVLDGPRITEYQVDLKIAFVVE